MFSFLFPFNTWKLEQTHEFGNWQVVLANIWGAILISAHVSVIHSWRYLHISSQPFFLFSSGFFFHCHLECMSKSPSECLSLYTGKGVQWQALHNGKSHYWRLCSDQSMESRQGWKHCFQVNGQMIVLDGSRIMRVEDVSHTFRTY